MIPRDTTELARLLKSAAEARSAVWPGRNLSLAHLAAVLDHQPDDLTITVQAGATLGLVQERLGLARQWLPHRPAGGARATIGALLATHRPGLTRLGHGPLRDRVLGMTVALSTGELAKSGGRVVKNVAGYDLHRLHCGAHGTLGVIAEVTLKVLPLPPGRTLLMMPLASIEGAGPFARALVGSSLLPVAVIASEGLAARGPGGEDLAKPWLWVAFEDVTAARERCVRECAERAAAAGLPPLVRHEGAELPQVLAELAEPAPANLLRMFVPGAKIARLAEAARGAGAVVADMGEGIVHVATADAGWIRERARLARELGGWSQLVRGEESVREAVGPARAPERTGAAARMEALRQALDPAGVMCPGLLLDGVL